MGRPTTQWRDEIRKFGGNEWVWTVQLEWEQVAVNRGLYLAVDMKWADDYDDEGICHFPYLKMFRISSNTKSKIFTKR